MRESILPRMKTETQETVIGGIAKHVSDKKLTIVLGEPGEGKTTTVLDFCSPNSVPSYYFRCSPNISMKSMLQFLARAIGTRVVGNNDDLQAQIKEELQQNPNYCFAFDEAEYLVYGNWKKIEAIRQLYDDTSVPFILCGTYDLKDLISGNESKGKRQTHNRPQIFRRLRKEEFKRIEEQEVITYLEKLEGYYAVRFSSQAKALLSSLCRDRQCGGLGNFIEVLELLFSTYRPEWEDISLQLIRDSGRTLHTHDEPAQSCSTSKHTKENKNILEEPISQETEADQSAPLPRRIDISKLEVIEIDLKGIKDVLQHKMTR